MVDRMVPWLPTSAIMASFLNMGDKVRRNSVSKTEFRLFQLPTVSTYVFFCPGYDILFRVKPTEGFNTPPLVFLTSPSPDLDDDDVVAASPSFLEIECSRSPPPQHRQRGSHVDCISDILYTFEFSEEHDLPRTFLCVSRTRWYGRACPINASTHLYTHTSP